MTTGITASSNPSDNPSDRPALVKISKSSKNASSFWPYRAFKYISNHTTKASLICASILGVIIIEKKLLYPAALVTAAIITKKVANYFRINRAMNENTVASKVENDGNTKLKALSSGVKSLTLQEKQDSFVLAFLTDQLLTSPGPQKAPFLEKKGLELYKKALCKLAPKVSITDFNISLYDILVELEILDPKIETINTTLSYSNYEISNCLKDAITTLKKAFEKRNTPVGAYLHLCRLSFGILYYEKKFILYNPMNSICKVYKSDKQLITKLSKIYKSDRQLIAKLSKNNIFARTQSNETKSSISFNLNLFTKKSATPRPFRGKADLLMSAEDIRAIEGTT